MKKLKDGNVTVNKTLILEDIGGLMMANRYEDHIMRYVRENLGLEPDDTSRDEEISNMSQSEVLDRVLTWHGLCNYGDTVLNWVDDIFNVDLCNM